METIESVRQIPGFDGYFISTEGKVFNKKGLEIKSRIQKRVHGKGYPIIDLRKDKKTVTIFVHKLVMLTYFEGKPSSRHQIRHLDGDKTNNSIFNLDWGTPEENMRDKLKTGTYGQKLSADQVCVIRSRAKNKENPKKLAEEYQVHLHTIYKIIRRETWGYI
jgi:hypothetical protein